MVAHSVEAVSSAEDRIEGTDVAENEEIGTAKSAAQETSPETGTFVVEVRDACAELATVLAAGLAQGWAPSESECPALVKLQAQVAAALRVAPQASFPVDPPDSDPAWVGPEEC